MEATCRQVMVGDLTLNVAEAGPEDGPLVLLLHGFPDFWGIWRRQMPALAAAGYRVVAPDQRGYNLSDKPKGAAAYRMDRLADDVAGLARALGRARFCVVGHDWGGIVAWRVALQFPDEVEALAVLNAPHPALIGPQVLGRPSQAAKSAYVGFFQLPGLPEAMLSANDHAALRRALVKTSPPETFTPEELDAHQAAWAQPGAVTGGLNYYRGLRHRPPAVKPGVKPPTLVIWGGRDPFLEEWLGRASLAYCRDGRGLRAANAGHWIQLEEAEAVNAALLGFLPRAA